MSSFEAGEGRGGGGEGGDRVLSFNRLPNLSLKLNSLRFPSLYKFQPRSQLPASKLSIWGVVRSHARATRERRRNCSLARSLAVGFACHKWRACSQQSQATEPTGLCYNFIFLRSNFDGLLGAQTNRQVVTLVQLVVNPNYPRRRYP